MNMIHYNKDKNTVSGLGRKILIFLLSFLTASVAILSISGSAYGAITYVRSNGSTGTSTTLDIGSPGTNRLVVIFADDESKGNNLSGVTVDGKSCTLVTRANNTVGAGNHLEMWYIDEDGLGSSSGIVTIAITGGDSGWAVHAHLYTGVDQYGPTDYGIDETSASTTTATVTGIDVPANGLVAMGSGQGTGGLTAIWTSPLVERIDGGVADPSSADMADASAVESTQQTNKTYVCTWSGTFNRATAIVAVWAVPSTANLTDHTAGQETDNLEGDLSVTGEELFAFKLTNNTGSTVTVSQVIFQLSLVTGILQSDFANLAIYVDSNDDGTIDAGETTTVGGSGVVDAGVTTITFSTDFTISASATVNYILKGDVSNLVVNDTVTIDLGASNVTLTSGSVGHTSATSVTHTADDTVILADHAVGQETDKFRGNISVSGAELFAFKLTNNTGSTVTVSQVVFQLSLVTGILQSDFTNLAIYVDSNNDGTIGAGETTTVGGSGVVDAGVTTITFSTDFTISASATVNYILKGDVSNLVVNDTVTISQGTGNVTLISGSVGGSGTTGVTHTAVDTVILADHAVGQETDKFRGNISVSGAELFAYKLTSNADSTVTVSQVVFQLSLVTGILQGDFTNLTIYVDDNNDGTIEAGEITTVGGSGVVNAGVTTITFSTGFTISASATVNYILKGDVSNLVAGDTVTIDLGASNVTLISGSVGGSGTTGVTHTAVDTVYLANHASGQETDKFRGNSSVSGAELFAFRLTSNADSTITVDQVIFPLSLVTGILQTDFANLAICVDDNNDGTIGAGEITTVGGSGVVDAGVSTITFSTGFTISASATVNYILKGDVGNVVPGDTVTIGLGIGNVTLISGSVGGSGTTGVTHTAVDTVYLANHASGQERSNFGIGSSVTGAELFAFKLTSNADSTVTVSQVVLQLSLVTGIVQGDFSNLAIYLDSNNDGTIDAGEITTVGGSGIVDAGVTTITFSTDFTISASAAVNYILKGDVSNLVAGDTVTINLGTGNVTLISGSVGGSGTTGVTHTADSPEISRVGNWNTGLSHTVGGSANTDRLLVFITGFENDGDTAITGVTYGGQAMTAAVQYVTTATGYKARCEIWYLNESGIQVASGTTFVVSYASGAPSDPMHAAATFSWVDQINPIVDTAQNQSSSGYNPNVDPITATVNVVAGGMAIAGAVCGNDGSYTWGFGWTDGTDQASGATTTMSTAENAATADGTDTASADHSSTINRQVIVVASLAPSSAEGYGIFSYRSQLTIDSDRVCGTIGSFTDFPVLVLIQNNNDLKTTANGGKVRSAFGYDIIFRASDGKTQLYHEVEKYDGTAGTLIAWVKFPTLSKSSDTIFYMYYGNSGITSATHEPDQVWDSNYVGVWHLKETTGTHYDSTSYGNNGIPGGGVIQDATGKINGADDFDGTNDYIEISTTGFTTTNMTFTAWAKVDALADHRYLFGHTTQPAYADRIQIYTNGIAPTLLGLGLGDTHSKDIGSALSTGTWYHVALVKDATNYWVYLDNVLDMSGTYTGLSALQTYADIGNDGNSLERTESWNGVIDEVRISNIVRDSEWICAEYNNQKWPNKTDFPTDGFITVGSAEDIECNYSYYKEISIQSSQVSGLSDLSDFPALINISSDNDLRTVANGGDVENPSGYDIIFRDIWGTQLDHEVEEYDGTNGKLVAWVKIPTLKYNENTVIYMYYGNECISSSTANPTGVWDSNYVGVWHLKEDPSRTAPQMKDSTSNGNDGTSAGTMTSGDQVNGRIDGSLDFDGTDDYISVPHNSSLDITGDMTIEIWFKYDTWSSWDYFVGKGYDSGSDVNYTLQFYNTSGNYSFDYTDSINTWCAGNVANTTLIAGNWYHTVVTYNSSTRGYSYFLNGTSDGGGTGSGDMDTTSYGLGIACDGFGDTWACFDGIIDEVRISNIARSAGWIQTEYNNQWNPSAFYNIGNEEEYSPTVVKLISFRATGQGASVLVEWETAQEVDNLGFNLYRSSEPYGSYTKLNRHLIPGLISSVSGQQYTYTDTDVTRGVLYYYMLEDVDLSGTRTMHGPVCVDWDGDGIPDDYDEQKDDGSDEDTGEEDPKVEIPLLELYEIDLGHEDWTPSGSSSSWVKLESFRARQEDEGVALEWETSYEVDNLGFHIYREADGKFYRITANLVSGSVFKVGAGRELPAGQSYLYWDGLSACTGHELYWLDSVELNGGRASFGPIKPEISGQPIAKRLKACFKSITEYQISRARALRKIRELREELSTRSTQKMKSQAIFYSIVPVKSSEPRLPPSEEQWALSAEPGVKIYIKEDGWYRVGEPELVTAGLRPGVDPRYLQLYADGEEQSMMVTGGEDGRFDPDDTIEFYGTGLDTPFTDAHVYWLVVGSRPGRRLDTPFTDIRIGPDKRMRVPRGLRGRGAPLSFPYTVELKERTFYFAALKNGERESFFGSVISTEPVDQLLTVAHPDPSPPEEGMLEVVLQGATDFSHQIKIQLNYVEIGQVVFSGQELWRAEIPIPQGYLLEGDNIITLAAQGGSLDVSLVDYIRLTYWRTYTADEDSLRFKASGGEWLSIGGFSSPGIRVLDITDPLRMLNVRGKVKTQDSGYAITFKVPMGGERTLLVFTEEKIKGPAGMAANLASSWHVLGQQGAEVIIIGHRDLLESVRSLRELREQQGWSVVLVDVEDLYDEFNFGAKSPWALKDFLGLAYEYWNPQPRFLLLVGDTSYDPRNYLGLGEFDLVPTKFVDTEYLKTASDDWFVDFDDDGLPEMAVGRLPVESAEEGAAVVSKIISYEGVAGLMSEALLVADVNAGFDYEGATADVRSLLPGDITVREIFRGQSPTARSDLLNLLNQGQLLVNYFGHGSTKTWKGNLLTYSDAWNLTNSPYLPFFVSMTCLNGFFQDPYSESLAEALLKTERGGALAVWTSSGLTYPGGQISMNKELIRLLFNGQGLTIGEAIIGAKQAVNNQDIRKTWILFGDPTIKLR